jgi:hypothetical protein
MRLIIVVKVWYIKAHGELLAVRSWESGGMRIQSIREGSWRKRKRGRKKERGKQGPHNISGAKV